MTTEPTTPTSTPASSTQQTASQPSPAAAPASSTPAPAPAVAPAPSPAVAPAPSPAPAKADDDLLLNPNKKPDDKPADKPVDKPPAADMKKFLEEKLGDKKTELEGKTDEEIAKLYDDQKAKDAAAPTFKLEELVIPDDLPVPEAIKSKVTEVANKHKLGKEAMQELTDIHIEMQRDQLKQWNDMKQKWRDGVKSDPVLGGENLDKSVAAADAVVRRFAGTPEELAEFSADLKILGLGNKKSFVRLMNNIAAATGEDTQQPGSGSGEEKLPPEKVLYPNMK